MKLVAVVLSGGSGSRLWPLSTDSLPKPFLPLFGEKNLLEKTLYRLSFLPLQATLIVTNQKYYTLHKKSQKQISPQKPKLKTNFLLEPVPKNTAPAVLMAAHWVKQHFGEDTIMLVLPADHLIENNKAFSKDVLLAAKQAEKQGIVTFGIKPSHPETGYGYICTGEREVAKKIQKIARFVEKPDLKTAQKYVKSKKYFWNSGIFCFSVKSIISAFQEFQPKIWQNSILCAKKTVLEKKADAHLLEENSFNAMNSISLDYGIMEKYQPIYAIQSNFDWNDVGSWKSIAMLRKADKSGNKLQGDFFSLENKNTFLQSEKNFYALIGLENISIVEGDGAVLIVANSHLQEVRQAFEFARNKVKTKKFHSFFFKLKSKNLVKFL